jgi:hypothetical protein
MKAVVFDMPHADYLAFPAISQSALKVLRDQSPAHCRAYLDGVGGAAARETDALVFGRLFDWRISSPTQYDANTVKKPDGMSFATTEGKAWRAGQGSKTIIEAKVWDKIEQMACSIERNSEARDLLTVGSSQVSVFAPLGSDPEWISDLLVDCKGRIDRVPAEFTPRFGKGLVDYKTTESANPADFGRQAFNLGYHIQAAFYLDLWNEAKPDARRTKFFFLAVEKDPPFVVVVFELPKELIALGREEYCRLLALYSKCDRSREWPDYGTAGIVQLQFPAWALRGTSLERKEAA